MINKYLNQFKCRKLKSVDTNNQQVKFDKNIYPIPKIQD